MILKKLIKFIVNEEYRFLVLAERGRTAYMSSEDFLKKLYEIKMGKALNLDNPTNYTEKLQWLKLFDHKPEYTTMVDKCAAKEYVANKIGHQYIIPTLGIWDDPEKIDFSILPDKFVIKCNHNSGLGMYICHDKSMMDISKVKKNLKRGMAQNYYLTGREWPYKNVKPLIIAESYMEDSHYKELRDYKFFTFDGVPKVLYITQGRGKGKETVADFFDMEFNHLPFAIDHNMANIPPQKPECFEEMKRLATILSEGMPQLRVDFYEVDGRIYFGEMTFFHCSGFERFHPEEWDKTFGEWLVLPSKSEHS